MLLWLSRHEMTFSEFISWGLGPAGCWIADKTGRGRSRGGQALMRSRPAGQGGGPGDGRRIVSRPAGCGSRLEGQAVPGSAGASAGRRAQVRVDLAGDVTLETADDFLLRQAFFGAPDGVGAGRWVGAEPGDHDPVEGMVGLAVAAGVEAVAGDLP